MAGNARILGDGFAYVNLVATSDPSQHRRLLGARYAVSTTDWGSFAVGRYLFAAKLGNFAQNMPTSANVC